MEAINFDGMDNADILEWLMVSAYSANRYQVACARHALAARNYRLAGCIDRAIVEEAKANHVYDCMLPLELRWQA